MTTGRINQVSSVSAARENLQPIAQHSDTNLKSLLHYILKFTISWMRSLEKSTRKAGNQSTNLLQIRRSGKFEMISLRRNAISVAISTMPFLFLPLAIRSILSKWIQNSLNSPITPTTAVINLHSSLGECKLNCKSNVNSQSENSNEINFLRIFLSFSKNK